MVLGLMSVEHENQTWVDRDSFGPGIQKEGSAVAFNALTGQTLGKYQVLEPLGRGGMAQVYRAYHPRLDRYVAIKVLRWDLVEEEAFLGRFQREAREVADLRHPHIVHVHDFDVQDEITYMVMELLAGDTLKARLNDYRLRDERMPLGEVLRLSLDILDGLAYAHSEGMIHRDIKPANIMLTKRGQAVITDFGIAQIVGGTRHTVTGALMGTLNYMAPEQGMAGDCDERSDLYSFGIVLYEMLTQQVPFDADTPIAIMMKHVNDPLPLPRQVSPDMPAVLEQILLKALAKPPEDRFQNAEAMSQALIEAVETLGLTLPKQISMPLSFTTSEAPAEAVAVFSGTAREKLQEADFARDETAVTLEPSVASSQSLQAETADPLTEQKAHRSVFPILGETDSELSSKLEKLAEIWGIFPALLVLVMGNLALLLLAGTTGAWAVYSRGWPAQIILLGMFLCGVMIERGSIKVLVPAGIVLGNGLILAYYGLTGNWHHWTVLWPLEPLLMISVLVTTSRLIEADNEADLARFVAQILVQIGAVAVGVILIVSLILWRTT